MSKDLSESFVSNIRVMGEVVQGIHDIRENVVRVLEQLRDAKIVMINSFFSPGHRV